MRKTLRASVLVLALCAPAFAGDIPNPSSPQPPPQNMTAEEQPSVTTEAQATGGNTQDKAGDSLTETVLSLLEGMLALF
jgi:hypothetical protein